LAAVSSGLENLEEIAEIAGVVEALEDAIFLQCAAEQHDWLQVWQDVKAIEGTCSVHMETG
jgi:hypothetical protein